MHPRGIALDRGVDELADPREFNDVIEYRVDFSLFHSQQGRVQVGVFAAGELRMHSGSHFDECPDSSADLGESSAWLRDARQQLEQGALPGAVAANDAQHFAFLESEGDIFEGPQNLLRRWLFELTHQPFKGTSDGLLRSAQKAFGRLVGLAEYVTLAEILGSDHRARHGRTGPDSQQIYHGPLGATE